MKQQTIQTVHIKYITVTLKWCQLWSSINPSRSKLVEVQNHCHIGPDIIKYSSLDHETQHVHLF